MANELTSFGAKLKAKRKEAKVTQQALADALGLNVRHIQRIEAGEADISLSRICQLAKALNQEAWVFIYGLESLVEMPEPRAPTRRKRKPSLPKVNPASQSLALQYIRRSASSPQWTKTE